MSGNLTAENKEPLVSIIMNCYNGEKYLKEAIDSIYAQTYQNWEIVFWDNASTDGSAEIAKNYDKRMKYHYSKINEPLGKARNRAMKKANGDFIAFLDVDDVYLPTKLAKQIKKMAMGQFALCYTGMFIIDGSGRKIKTLNPSCQSGFIFKQQLARYEIGMPTVMLSKKALDTYAYCFDENLQFAPDYKLFMSIAAQHKIYVINETLVCYRDHSDNLTHRLYDILPIESEKILLELKAAFPKEVGECKREFKIAIVDQVSFIRVKCYLEKGDVKSARRVLSTILWYDYRYIVLLCILCLPRFIYNYAIAALGYHLPVLK